MELVQIKIILVSSVWGIRDRHHRILYSSSLSQNTLAAPSMEVTFAEPLLYHYLHYRSVIIPFLLISISIVFDLTNLVFFVIFVFFTTFCPLIISFYFFSYSFQFRLFRSSFLVNISKEKIKIFPYYFTHILIFPAKWQERD